MAALLPDDILHIVCHQLWEQRDFNTLFRCACAGKQIAVPALAKLYSMHEFAPCTSSQSDLNEVLSQHQTTAQGRNQRNLQWAIMWRSIVLSSLGKTLFPYSKYVRSLRIQDLEALLDTIEGQDSSSTQHKSKLNGTFFEGPVGTFNTKKTVYFQKKPSNRFDKETTVNRLAMAILQRTPMLEELDGNLAQRSLSQCLPNLPNLRGLNVYQGEALEATGNLFRLHCPFLKTLSFYGWAHADADHHFATFLNDLRPQSLQYFEIYSTSQIGAESFLALNCHRDSLKDLKLNSIKAEAIQAMSMLKGCTNLTTLELAENAVATQDLEKRHNDVFLEMIAWLCECKKLKSISLKKLLNAPALLTPVSLESDIRLTSLILEGYLMSEARSFHEALTNQPSLQRLWLKGESSDLGLDVDVLAGSLCKLENLTDLQLKDVSDNFLDKHICKLAQSLPKLETWWTSGYAITDVVWSDITSLRNLRKLDFNADTRFTSNGIMNFITNLGPGNQGLSLTVQMADMDYDLSEEEQTLIRDTISSQVDGEFSFQLNREIGEGDSSEADSD